MTSFALLANPAAGSGNEPEAVRAALQAAGGREVAEDVAERLVVAGGDGTVAPAAQRAGELGVPLAVIPVGTANDFARAFALPLDVGEACALAIGGHTTRPVELGWLNGDVPFVNACSAGLPVSAARWARSLKRWLGPLAYAAGAVRARVTARPVSCVVVADGERIFAGAVWQLIVACTGHFGGGSSIGSTEPGDGELDLAIVAAGPRMRLVRYAYAMRAGRLTADRDVHHARARTVEISGGLTFNQDGELRAPREPAARFTAQAAAFSLVTPQP